MIIALISIGVEIPDYIPICVLILQMFGMLGSPFITLLYILEQIEILMGGTPRASI